ncbi:MAG: exodeoxyribonuclease V alpha subunit [Ignavibacteria bacterium]|nr:MAG: exodeoxyribonuclease V alpha subunit [Ignavibacteria bacterium]KAF0157953.1 MAG: exodeoxyribonuclease V alpha subunit [Ignavibacteria bacterium]
MQIEEVVESFIYKNESNGYCVAVLSNGVKAVGILSAVKLGEKLKLTGEFVTHPKFGEQFKVDSYALVLPTTIDGIVKYLGSGLVKGIGPSTAEKIVGLFQSEAIDVLDNEPERLLQVDGIGKKKLEVIKKSWEEQKAAKDIMIYLQSFDISPAYAMKIFNMYGRNSIQIVKENPYLLTNVWGIGFKTADKIGKSVGFADDNHYRLKSGIVYVLNNAANDGHVYLPLTELIQKCNELLEVDLSDSLLFFRELDKDGTIKISGENIYLQYFYKAERSIEYKIKDLLRTSCKLSQAQLNTIVLKSDYYSEEQLEAIRNSLLHKILILTGGPGTGKTTALKGIIDSYKQLGKKIMLAAPTGRAAKRMSEVIGMEAKTIHRLLEYNPEANLFLVNADEPLKADLVVIDEVSMIDTMMMYHLVDAIHSETTLVLVGDVDQLPSVGCGNILNDLIRSGLIPTAMLTKIFRQAEQSQIVINAHRINKGDFPIVTGNETSDFFFIQEPDSSKIPSLIVELCSKRLPAKYKFDPLKDIQVLSPMYKGETGVDNINSLQQSMLNNSNTFITKGDKLFKIGDKVIQLRNNYDKDIYNGDIGVITKINKNDQNLEAEFGERLVRFEYSELEDVSLAYAVTVHKSQGSEYPCVIMPITTSHYVMLQRNLLYTAVTRASQMMILIGSRQALMMAIKNKKSNKRYTSLFSEK